MDENKPILNSIAVDASCVGNPGPVEWQAIHPRSGTKLFTYGPLQGGTNNLGEFLGIVHALAFCKKHNIKVPVYSDSVTAISWVKAKDINTTMQRTEKNAKLFEIIDRAIKWLKENTYTNEVLKWNTREWGEIPSDFGRKGA